MEELPRLLLGGLKIGAVYSLAALGIVVIHKATRTVNFAHGALIMLGAYFGFFLLRLPMPWSICSHRSRSAGLPWAPGGCSCAGCDDPMLSTWSSARSLSGWPPPS